MKLCEACGLMQIYVAKCCEIFLFFMIISFSYAFGMECKIYFMVVKIYFNEKN